MGPQRRWPAGRWHRRLFSGCEGAGRGQAGWLHVPSPAVCRRHCCCQWRDPSACSSRRLRTEAAAYPPEILPLIDAQLFFPSPSCALQPRLLEAAALADEQVSKVAAGSRHTLLLCASGKAFACGWGAFGQLGTGGFKSASTPQAVAVPAGAKVTDLAAGWWHTLFLAE